MDEIIKRKDGILSGTLIPLKQPLSTYSPAFSNTDCVYASEPFLCAYSTTQFK